MKLLSWLTVPLLLAFYVPVCFAETRSSEKLNMCIICHGVDGRGNESIRAPKIAGMEPWYILLQLTGFQQEFRGKHADDMDGREMRAMAKSLDEADIEQAITLIAGWPVEKPRQPLWVTLKRGERYM
jgi:cytochrome c553